MDRFLRFVMASGVSGPYRDVAVREARKLDDWSLAHRGLTTPGKLDQTPRVGTITNKTISGSPYSRSSTLSTMSAMTAYPASFNWLP